MMPVKPVFNLNIYISKHVHTKDIVLFHEVWKWVHIDKGLKDFFFDGGTRTPDGIQGLSYLFHDLKYYFGGTKDDRRIADDDLQMMMRARKSYLWGWVIRIVLRFAQFAFRKTDKRFHIRNDGNSWRSEIPGPFLRRSRLPLERVNT